MAVSVSLTISPTTTPAHGTSVTATYAVSGNTSGAGTPVSVAGTVTVGGQSFPVTGSFTMPGSGAAAPVTYAVPTCPGLAFQATANPAAFTALVP
jgi:hypothetical protein